jgi:CheY-like chemotaxis protein
VARILILEDNEMGCGKLSRRLKKREFDISMGVDGEAGVEMPGSEPPVVLLDTSSPVIDGWTAARHVKGDDRNPQPHHALTAHAPAGDGEKVPQTGDDDDTTPVDIDRFVSKIEALVTSSEG